MHQRAAHHRAPRKTRARLRRARTVRGALGVTLLGAVLPGAGLLWTGRLIGYLLLVPTFGGAVYALAAFRDWHALVELATDPAQLRSMTVFLGIGLGVWVVNVLATYWWARPLRASRLPATAGAVIAVLACTAAALPVVHTMRIATVQADLVETLFTENQTATSPRGITEEDPWGGRDRVSILLLGGDGSVTRDGDPHRLGDAAGAQHPDRTVGDVQPAAQHDVRRVPRGQPAARPSSRRASPPTATRPAAC